MIDFALLGAGRIGRMHAANVASRPDTRLRWVYDVNADAAREVAATYGSKVASSVDEALGDTGTQAVLIASSTDTHVDLLTRAAKAGKAVLCEKPIDLDIERVDACARKIAGCTAPIMVGFNRRFDPTHAEVRRAAHAGEIGTVEQVIITSRDPEPPPIEYERVAGGMFRDMTIHDFDLARYMLGEEPVAVSAMASCLFDPAAKELGDIDTAMVIMRTASGKLCHINNSRHASYGYDQRIEVHGSTGMVQSNNRRANECERFGAATTAARSPLMHFFIERYTEAFAAEMDEFAAAIAEQRTPSASFEDGRRALLIANAAYDSLRTGAEVAVPD